MSQPKKLLFGLTALMLLVALLSWRMMAKSDSNSMAAVSVPEVVSLAQLQALQSSDILYVDARATLFFKRRHIPGAISVSKESVERDFEAALAILRQTTKLIVVYCSDASCEDANYVANKLIANGLKRVSVYPGGWIEWSNASMPSESTLK